MKKIVFSLLLIMGISNVILPLTVKAENKLYSGIWNLPAAPENSTRGAPVKAFQTWYNSNCLADGESALVLDGVYGPLTHAAKQKSFNGCGSKNELSPTKAPSFSRTNAPSDSPRSSPAAPASSGSCVSDAGGNLPPVMHGCILPGPNSGKQGVSYISDRLLPSLTSTLLVYILSLSVGVIMVGGIIYIVSSGDPELTGKAKDAIIWAIAGSIIAILSYTIVKFIIGINFMGM